MSATTYEPGMIDIAQTPAVPMSRHVSVELRKMLDTKAGLWLMITIGVITGLATLIFGLVGHADDKVFGTFIYFAWIPQSFLLPVLGILLITQEWGQRTAMVTFTLEPHRGRIVSAKIVAALILAVTGVFVAVAFAALATAVFGGTDPWSGFGAIDVLGLGFVQVAGVLLGLTFGLLFLNSAAAIVVYFVLPQVVSIVANIWPLLSDKSDWIDFGTAQGPLFEFGEGGATGEEWVKIAVTGFVWLVIPFTLGLWRMLRAELK